MFGYETTSDDRGDVRGGDGGYVRHELGRLGHGRYRVRVRIHGDHGGDGIHGDAPPVK